MATRKSQTLEMYEEEIKRSLGAPVIYSRITLKAFFDAGVSEMTVLIMLKNARIVTPPVDVQVKQPDVLQRVREPRETHIEEAQTITIRPITEMEVDEAVREALNNLEIAETIDDDRHEEDDAPIQVAIDELDALINNLAQDPEYFIVADLTGTLGFVAEESFASREFEFCEGLFLEGFRNAEEAHFLPSDDYQTLTVAAGKIARMMAESMRIALVYAKEGLREYQRNGVIPEPMEAIAAPVGLITEDYYDEQIIIPRREHLPAARDEYRVYGFNAARQHIEDGELEFLAAHIIPEVSGDYVMYMNRLLDWAIRYGGD